MTANTQEPLYDRIISSTDVKILYIFFFIIFWFIWAPHGTLFEFFSGTIITSARLSRSIAAELLYSPGVIILAVLGLIYVSSTLLWLASMLMQPTAASTDTSNDAQATEQPKYRQTQSSPSVSTSSSGGWEVFLDRLFQSGHPFFRPLHTLLRLSPNGLFALFVVTSSLMPFLGFICAVLFGIILGWLEMVVTCMICISGIAFVLYSGICYLNIIVNREGA